MIKRFLEKLIADFNKEVNKPRKHPTLAEKLVAALKEGTDKPRRQPKLAQKLVDVLKEGTDKPRGSSVFSAGQRLDPSSEFRREHSRPEKGSEKSHPNTFTVMSKYGSRTFHGVQLTVKCWAQLFRESSEPPVILANRKDIDVFTRWVSKHKDLEVARYFREFGVAEPYAKMFECLKEDVTGIGNSLPAD